MGMSRATKSNNFASALRSIRKAYGLSQEDFSLVSSRTYVSSLERSMKSPTLSKVDDLAEVLGVHPLTLLTLSYLRSTGAGDLTEVLNTVEKEISGLK